MVGADIPRPRPGSSLSSAEIERFYPCVTPIIYRGSWTFHETGDMNQKAGSLGRDHRRSDFNALRRYHFPHPWQASDLAEYVFRRRLHRLVPNSTAGAAREEVVAELARMALEREAILAWGRSTGMLREVVQQYRFERRAGAHSQMAHAAAAKLIEAACPTIADPANYAGVLIVWAEREHRAWFWRCCRDHHVL